MKKIVLSFLLGVAVTSGAAYAATKQYVVLNNDDTAIVGNRKVACVAFTSSIACAATRNFHHVYRASITPNGAVVWQGTQKKYVGVNP
jgi:hypothetical protein